MKISINTSSFSFRFIGVIFIIASIIVAIWSWPIAVFILLLAIIVALQKHKYIVPKPAIKVIEQVEKTMKSLSLHYQRTGMIVTTKTVTIHVSDYHLFTLLRFTFDKRYTVQGTYLAEAVAKYQRYI